MNGEGRAKAREIISAMLADGPRPAAEMLQAGLEAGVSHWTMWETKARMHVGSYRECGKGLHSPWYWRPPRER
jgi:hypothetical protein